MATASQAAAVTDAPTDSADRQWRGKNQAEQDQCQLAREAVSSAKLTHDVNRHRVADQTSRRSFRSILPEAGRLRAGDAVPGSTRLDCYYILGGRA
jgi:hypothetical protein